MSKDNKLEIEQAFIRLCGLGVSASYLFWLSERGSLYNALLVSFFGVLYTLIAVTLKILAERDIGKNVFRRYFGIVVDVSMATTFMLLLSGYGALLFAVYVWVTIGNGFRYGVASLAVSATLSLIGFSIVYLVSDFWEGADLFAAMCFVVLLIVPIYVAPLLRRLMQEKTRSEKASAEKSRFIANVSHELRTPLNAIVGFSNLVDKVDDRAERQRMAELMQEAAASLVALVENVLDFSRIEAGYVELRSEVMDLRRMLGSIGGMFSLQAQEKGIDYCTVVDDAVPDYVAGDMQRMRQILVNLIGNAVKFTEQGRVDVSLGVGVMDAGRQFLRFEIRDTGPGFPGEMRNRIFERFTQVDDSARRKHQGAGLGTAIAKSLVELMGGCIDVVSVPDAGSCFWFEVPLRRPTSEQLREHLDSILAGKEQNQPARGISVLVAEDCEINRYVYKKMFDWLGIEVDFAETGEQVFELLERGHYRLLIVDMQMPGMSGIDIVTRYNDITLPERRIPVVVITGDATPDLAEECHRLGVSAFLAKPVQLPKLRALSDRFIFAGMSAESTRPV